MFSLIYFFFFIPTHSLTLTYTSCLTSPCTPYISISMNLPIDENTPTTLTLTSPATSSTTSSPNTISTTISDEYGRQWALSSPITLSFQPTFVRLFRTMSLLTSTYNIYEISLPLLSSTCPSSTLCCPPTSYRQYRYNETSYFIYEIENGHLSYMIQFMVSQINYDYVTTITSYGDPISVNTSNFSLLVGAPIINIPNYSQIAAATDRNITEFRKMNSNSYTTLFSQFRSLSLNDFFLIPKQFLHNITNPKPNTIGMNRDTYLLYTNCTNAMGSTIAVNSGSIYDQFSTFRTSTFQNTQNCEIDDIYSSTYDYTSLLTALKCPFKSMASLPISLQLTSPNVIPQFPILYQIECGLFFPSPTTNMTVIYVVFENRGTDGRVSVTLQNCCQNSECLPIPDISQTQTTEITHGRVVFQFFFLTNAFTTETAKCNVNISYPKNPRSEQTICLLHQPNSETPFNPSLNRTDGMCTDTQRLFLIDTERYCGEMCSQDEHFVPYRLVCEPINCTLKYQNQKNFYNYFTKRCEAIRICKSGIKYDSHTNTCISPTPLPPTLLQIECGPHGTAVIGSTCVCDAGWITVSPQSNDEFVWCGEKDKSVNRTQIIFLFVCLGVECVVWAYVVAMIRREWRRIHGRGEERMGNEERYIQLREEYKFTKKKDRKK
jgi:hypothetical protein